MKKILITEKPSVAMEFAKALKINTNRKNGYLESEEWIITWCVGHLVTMSYPEKYDEKLKQWRLDTLPFVPKEWKYEIIPQVANQFNIIQSLLQRDDISEIYNAGDSGREGEYIQRLVLMMAKPNPSIKIKRVWIDSQTEEEILRGIREAKDASEYDSLSDSAYLRAKEDYLIGINFSRLLSITQGRMVAKQVNEERTSIAIGRVMTCVLGMVVAREREIRNFVKTKYYKITGKFGEEQSFCEAEWKVNEKSIEYNSAKLYNETGFKKKQDAEEFINKIKDSVDIIIVDFHAEATAEKIAMGYFLDGKITCLYGTHTHVATADETILEKGTAYITDIGMSGPQKSVIGMDVDVSIKRFVTTLPERYKTSTDSKIVCNGIILNINDETCRVEKIRRIKL